jgi:hypothetical protein
MGAVADLSVRGDPPGGERERKRVPQKIKKKKKKKKTQSFAQPAFLFWKIIEIEAEESTIGNIYIFLKKNYLDKFTLY